MVSHPNRSFAATLNTTVKLTEEKAIDVRAMNLDVTGRAILVSQRCLVMKVRRVRSPNLVCIAVALETELSYMRTCEQLCICGTMRRVAGRATLNFQRCVFKDERSLLVCMTLQTACVGAR